MFHNTRKKIVIYIMTILILFLAVTLITIYGTSYISVRKQNKEMLERYVGIYSLEMQPGENSEGDSVNTSSSMHSFPDDLPPDLAGGQPPIPSGGIPSNDAGEISSDGVGEIPADGTSELSPDAYSDAPPLDGMMYSLSSFYSAAFDSSGNVLATDPGNNGVYTDEDVEKMAREILEKSKALGMKGNLLYITEKRDGYTLVAFMDTTLSDSSLDTMLINMLVVGLLAILCFFGVSILMSKRLVSPLEENDKRQKQFISDAEHELKTPISVVSANAEILARQIGDNKWLSNIRCENERMGNLVKELLDLSHAESDGTGRDFEEIDMSKTVIREVLPFESVAFEKGLTINSEVEENIRIKGNPGQIDRLISVLTDNAISHAAKGNVIEISLKQEHRNVIFTVSNPGEDIPEEVREHLFDRFYRGDAARTGNDGHFGLGLSIAKAITDVHKGKISAGFEDGKVIFTVVLPAE